jgi:predicted nucleic acid-binding protein
MPVLLWDASALAKRYSPELGSDTVDALFHAVPSAQMVTTFQGYAETLSVLVRKRNRGPIAAASAQRVHDARRNFRRGSRTECHETLPWSAGHPIIVLRRRHPWDDGRDLALR